MKKITRLFLFITTLALPTYAQAQDTLVDAGKTMNCPMMTDMQKEMGGMMGSMSDPTMKERMQRMHDKMGDMMARMQTMHEGMGAGMIKDGKMGNGMMGQGSNNSAASSENHDAHHLSR